jgi:hypothetical protein
MGTHHTILALAAAMGMAWLAGFVSPSAKRFLYRRAAWATIAIGGLMLSAASWFIFEERFGGTLFQRFRGWPKTFGFECLSAECEVLGPKIKLIYFLGNSFFYIAGLLLLWTLIAILLAPSDGRTSIG